MPAQAVNADTVPMWWQMYGPLIVAVVAGLVQWAVSLSLGARQAARDTLLERQLADIKANQELMLLERKAVIERKENQLSNFYGPIHLYLTVGEKVWSRLVKELEEDPGRFRLLMPENMAKAKASLAGDALVKRILEINGKIKTVLQANAGMVLAADDLKVYAQFLAHAEMLELAYEGRLQAPIDDFEVFPRDFPNLIKQGLDTLKTELGNLGKLVGSEALEAEGTRSRIQQMM